MEGKHLKIYLIKVQDLYMHNFIPLSYVPH